ncbi:glycine zipper 2TM domain-containing protein [Janthinobacterium fluminis]|uniref:Glycine zipper 2TM domain-containing protein n=1 Tax=Janthinobacterium fluminis TaxID=2987524 RepID=A0ABT5K1I6_9BURK|nr:glycine zipper 2TM domain-containing protein [Janthinobacterium fluminis]MDC8758571.1 glycine zipper 2TM domain-containing protein [Janthinobacterium fluminis]
MKALMTLALVSTMAAGLAGCVVAPNSGSIYTSRQAQNEQTVRIATVESVREVRIDKGNSGTGALTGAALGGLAGSTVGGGNGSVAAGILGAVAGGLAGDNVEANMKRHAGVEITVRLDSGELRAITQDADELFRPGERVRLLSDGRKTRVTH